MSKRKGISKKLRFEVFKRDSFTCQYCGRKAPDVLLVADHIEPVSEGGTADLLNLVTACRDCNAGKSNRRLSDSTALDKRRQQLEELQERKEQIEMMFCWQKELLDLDDQVANQLSDYWSDQAPAYSLNEKGLAGLKRLRRKYEIDEIMTAMKIAAEQYLEYEEGAPTKESVEVAWAKVGGICRVRRLARDRPYMGRLFYIRGILRNSLSYVNEHLALQLLQEAVEAGASIEALEHDSKSVRSWTEWREGIEAFIAEAQARLENNGEEGQP